MTTFAVTYTYDDRSDLRDRTRAEHRAFLRELLASGQLLASGPLAPARGSAARTGRPVPPGALLVVRSDDAEGALAALAGDPFQVAGLVAEVEIREWDPVIGPWATPPSP